MVVAGAVDLTALGFVATLRVVWMLTFIAFHPFVVHVVNIHLDSIDGGISTHLELSRDEYERLDKGLDLLYYIAAVSYCFVHLKDLWYARIMVPFLLWRIIGNILFIITLDSSILIIFPNVFQLLFGLYTFLDLIQVDVWIRDTNWLNALLIIIITFVKIIIEWFHHNEELPPPKDDETICRCENGWEWLASRTALLVTVIALAMYIGFTRVANYNPARNPPNPVKPPGWDLRRGRAHST